MEAELETNFQNLSLGTFDLAKFSGDALKTLYGTSDDVVLYWAHHEKLCLIDGKIAFMGGLDMCAYILRTVFCVVLTLALGFGRWDTNSRTSPRN